MDFGLTDEQRSIVQVTRAFVERELYPHEEEVERSGVLRPELAAEIREEGGSALVAPLDVQDREAVRGTAERIAEQLGGIDALVLAAGLNAPNPIANVRGIVVTITALGLWLEPVRTTFNYGQINLFLCALLLAGDRFCREALAQRAEDAGEHLEED